MWTVGSLLGLGFLGDALDYFVYRGGRGWPTRLAFSRLHDSAASCVAIGGGAALGMYSIWFLLYQQGSLFRSPCYAAFLVFYLWWQGIFQHEYTEALNIVHRRSVRAHLSAVQWAALALQV